MPNSKWPQGIPKKLDLPKQSITQNLINSTLKFPTKCFLFFYGAEYTYETILDLVEKLSFYLQKSLKIKPDERILLYMQNSPQFIISYYAILHAGAIVVPVNPMSKEIELSFIQMDTAARVIISGAEIAEFAVPLLRRGHLDHLIVTNNSDMANTSFDLKKPPFGKALPLEKLEKFGCINWQKLIETSQNINSVIRLPSDLAIIAYSSGTTGKPKGCVHTHHNVMVTAVGGVIWHNFGEDSISLATLPFFHVTGMQAAMNGPIYAGGTIVVMARWDVQIAVELIHRYKITHWRAISTMIIDLISDVSIQKYDLSSLKAIGGGGAPMPAAVSKKLKLITGLRYVEGYGLSETMAATHLNPPNNPKPQCLGKPVFGVISCICSLENSEILGTGEIGEILIAGPQIFLGYWNNSEETEKVFIEINGCKFLRTGDVGYVDEDGFFFLTDRLKRMINVSGFKVWPNEVETMMYEHPDISEVCVTSKKNSRSCESVKAFIVASRAPPPKASEIFAWCKDRMANYKCPRSIEYVESLPKSATGKIMWKELTD